MAEDRWRIINRQLLIEVGAALDQHVEGAEVAGDEGDQQRREDRPDHAVEVPTRALSDGGPEL